MTMEVWRIDSELPKAIPRNCCIHSFHHCSFRYLPTSNAPSLCREISFRGVSYVVCTVDLHAYFVRLFWKDPQQQPYGGFEHLPRSIGDGPTGSGRPRHA